ncbi:hypothetical protein J3R82DRAFT_8588 [Butyriboletus roseoflavus]|nr:hypothetical protein J3R82DRAFT_8588 [Butyriboletus roseoflavus]
MTIHSWGAVTPGNNDIDSQIKCIQTCKPALQRWKNIKVMIIDESELRTCHSHFSDVKRGAIAVSMLDGHLFNTLAALADRLRKKTNKPFGDIQVCICVFIE